MLGGAKAVMLEIMSRFHSEGVVQAQTELKQLQGTMGRFTTAQTQMGRSAVQTGKFLKEDLGYSINKQGQILQKSTAIWQNVDGQMRKTSLTSVQTAEGFQAVGNSAKELPVSHVKSFGAGMLDMAKRAAMVAPIWMLMRAAIKAVTGTLALMVGGFKDLDEQMARIGTIVGSTTGNMTSELANVRRAILDMAVDSRIALKDVAEAFYFLRTSALSSEAAMAAFRPTIALMEGTGVSAKEAARGVAGLYNTLKSTFDTNIPLAEQMAEISDILAYTYTKQDVEMKELLQSYAKLAPFLSVTKNSAIELVTVLGVLNTLLMRGGRAGRLTGRSLLEIATKAEKLADVFGIILPKDEPLDFLKFLDQISAKLDIVGGKITLAQTAKLKEVFNIRSLQNIQLLATNIDLVRESVKKAKAEYKAYAEEIAALKMRTISGQQERFGNIIRALGIDMITTATGTHGLADALTHINNALAGQRLTILGYAWAWEVYSRTVKRAISDMKHSAAVFELNRTDPVAAAKLAEKLEKEQNIVYPKARSFGNYFLETTSAGTAAEKKELKALADYNEKTNKDKAIQAGQEELITHRLKTQEAVLKAIGINEYAITLYKYQQAKQSGEQVDIEKAMLDVVKARAKIEEQNRTNQLSFMRQYLGADASKRKEMKDFIALSKLSGTELASRLGSGGYDEELIIKYWDKFSVEQKKALEKMALELGEVWGLQLPKNKLEDYTPEEEHYKQIAEIYATAMLDANSKIAEDLRLKLSNAFVVQEDKITKDTEDYINPPVERRKTELEEYSTTSLTGKARAEMIAGTNAQNSAMAALEATANAWTAEVEARLGYSKYEGKYKKEIELKLPDFEAVVTDSFASAIKSLKVEQTQENSFNVQIDAHGLTPVEFGNKIIEVFDKRINEALKSGKIVNEART